MVLGFRRRVLWFRNEPGPYLHITRHVYREAYGTAGPGKCELPDIHVFLVGSGEHLAERGHDPGNRAGCTGNLVSSDQKGVLTPVSGLIQAGNGEPPDLIAQYKSGMYQAGTLWKAQTLTYQRGKISPRASGLTSWKTGVV